MALQISPKYTLLAILSFIIFIVLLALPFIVPVYFGIPFDDTLVPPDWITTGVESGIVLIGAFWGVIVTKWLCRYAKTETKPGRGVM